jgi:hypothetical protein
MKFWKALLTQKVVVVVVVQKGIHGFNLNQHYRHSRHPKTSFELNRMNKITERRHYLAEGHDQRGAKCLRHLHLPRRP